MPKPISDIELPELLQNASLEELQALEEFAQWAAKHPELFVTGRRNGIRIGASLAVIKAVERMTDNKGIAANMLVLPQ